MSGERIPARQARRAAREARSLLRRGRKVLDEAGAREVEAAIEAVLARASAGEDATADVVALEAVVERRLAFARKSRAREYAEAIGTAVLIALALRAFVVEQFKIPSPSMVPTLEVGDRLLVAKFSYGVRVPFTSRYVLRWRELRRGDIVVFPFPQREATTWDRIGLWTERLERSTAPLPVSLGAWRDPATGSAAPAHLLVDGWGNALRLEQGDDPRSFVVASDGADGTASTADDITSVLVRNSFVGLNRRRASGDSLIQRCDIDPSSLATGKTYIKRIIGLAGDTVALRDNRLLLNGEPLVYGEATSMTVTTHGFPMQVQLVDETLPGGPTYTVRVIFGTERFGPITIPDGYVFVMGDNRDESSDSRCWGLVPARSVRGRATHLLWSLGSGGVDRERRFQRLR